MMYNNRKYLLVDGNLLLMRAIYATMHSGMEVADVNTGALLVFINTLAKHIREEGADNVGVAWDTGAPRRRAEIDEQYKENRSLGPVAVQRRKVRPLAKEFCQLAGITQAEQDGWEADDIVATWWGRIQTLPNRSPSQITLLSSDKDFLQLLGDNPWGVPTEQVRLSSFGVATDRWDAQRVQDHFGCTPDRLPFLMALMGDLADNVVGVKGIGPKKALKLMEKSEWDFLEAVATLKSSEDRERVVKNFALVNLRDVKVPLTDDQGWLLFDPPGDDDSSGSRYQSLRSFCAAWQLSTVLDRLPEDLWVAKPLPGKPFQPSLGASPLP